MHTCNILTRNYSSWTYTPPDERLTGPLSYRLFDGDVFTIDDEEGKQITVVESVIRKDKNIPGILLLENNRTYGRTDNNKRLYYKCKPNNPQIPCFLVAYDISVGFNKSYTNKYVTFSYHHWTDKHPVGVLSQNLGDVYNLPSFNEYQLYCKQLQTSIKPAVSATTDALRLRTVGSYQTEILENPTRYGSMVNLINDNLYIFTVDPPGCEDRDDALSIISSSNGEISEHVVTVHIANVWVWIEALGLADHLRSGSRVSTIYFPEMKRHMLPIPIGEELCSLDEKNVRFTFSMDFMVIDHPKKGVYIQYLDSIRPTLYQSVIQVSKNFVYEEPALLENTDYNALKRLTRKLDKTVSNSHDLVAFWMIQMNRYTAKHMKAERFGIFRTVQSKDDLDDDDGTPKLVVRAWEQYLAGEYVVYSNKNKGQNLAHHALGLSEYVHMTSPIRRMVDLLNQIAWVKYHIKEVQLSDSLTNFYEYQIGNISELNAKMKKIRRIQSDAHILSVVVNDPNILSRDFTGILLEKSGNNNHPKSAIYIEELKWITYCKIPEAMNLNETVSCKLFVFNNEEQMKKKIRIQIISP